MTVIKNMLTSEIVILWLTWEFQRIIILNHRPLELNYLRRRCIENLEYAISLIQERKAELRPIIL